MSAVTQADIGPVITGADIEQSLTRVLKDWLERYLWECATVRGEDEPPPAPRGWAITGRDLQKYNSDQLPCVVVMAGGVTSRPQPYGEPGQLTATWQVDIGAIHNAAWGYLSRQHAQLYVRAIALCLVQRPVVVWEGHTAVVDFTGETYDELDFSDTRTYSASIAVFQVTVENMMWRDGGPPPEAAVPLDPTVPFEPWTIVREVDIDVTNTYGGE